MTDGKSQVKWYPCSTFTRCPACGTGQWADPETRITCLKCGAIGDIGFFGAWTEIRTDQPSLFPPETP